MLCASMRLAIDGGLTTCQKFWFACRVCRIPCDLEFAAALEVTGQHHARVPLVFPAFCFSAQPETNSRVRASHAKCPFCFCSLLSMSYYKIPQRDIFCEFEKRIGRPPK